jgi:hypothetical protein
LLLLKRNKLKKNFFFLLILLAPHSWGASCFEDCSSFSNNPSTTPIPSNIECSYNNSNYISNSISWSYPLSHSWQHLEQCEINDSNIDNPELLEEIKLLNLSIKSLMTFIAFSTGVFSGLFVGRILINVF